MSRKAVISERKALPPAFTYTQARAAGISAERLYAYRAKGLIDQIARGLYRWADAPEIDQDLLEITHRAPRGTLCLVTALARHGLTDSIRRVSTSLSHAAAAFQFCARRSTFTSSLARRLISAERSSWSATSVRSASTRRSAHLSTLSGCAIGKGRMSRGKRFVAGSLAR